MREIALIFILIIPLFFFSCKKNISPKITQLIGINSQYLTTDSIVHFEFNTRDENGKVLSFKLYINNNLVKESTTNYMIYDFQILHNNIGINTFKLIALDNEYAESFYSSSFSVNDYRNPFLGEFRFSTKEVFTSYADTNAYIQTYIHDRSVILFEESHSQIDYYTNDDSHENPYKKLTFNGVTPTVTPDGQFVPKYGSHYYHDGHFSSDQDTIYFRLNTSTTFDNTTRTIIGIRK